MDKRLKTKKSLTQNEIPFETPTLRLVRAMIEKSKWVMWTDTDAPHSIGQECDRKMTMIYGFLMVLFCR